MPGRTARRLALWGWAAALLLAGMLRETLWALWAGEEDLVAGALEPPESRDTGTD